MDFSVLTSLPGLPALALARDTGASPSDLVTRDATLVASAFAGGTLSFSADGGAFSTVLPVFRTDGAHRVAVVERDAFGHDSQAVELAFVLDTKAPTVALSEATPSEHGTLALNGAVGVADAGALVRITDGATLVGSGTVAADGTWSVPVALSGNGTHTLVASLIDRAGNVGEATTKILLDTISAPMPAPTPEKAAADPAPLAPSVAATASPAAATATQVSHPALASETLSFAFASASVSADAHGIHLKGPDGVVHDVTAVQKLVFADGTIDRADANPLVDDLFYFAHNRDVWAAHADADQHYAQFGRAEGRAPNAFFSPADYLAHNPDVAAAGVDPLQHYDSFGWKEGRDPGSAFSTRGYLAANPDVAAAGLDPLAHFLAFGQMEGRHGWEIA